jgi:hypothetical protein
METKNVTMTPEWAQNILRNQNKGNRPIKNAAVAKLVKAIENGEWKLTHQGIAFDWNGNLVDGQHRLLAIAKSGASVPIAVTTNCDPSIFIACDIGAARTSSDVLSVNGATKNDATVIGAAIGIVVRHAKYPGLVWVGKARQVSHAEILDFYNKWDDWATPMKLTDKAYRGYRHVTPSNVLALILLARTAGHEWHTLYDFAEGLGTGANLPYDSALLTYRNYLQFPGARPPHSPCIQQHRLACIIKAFNYYAQGTPLKMFKQPNYPPMPSVCAPQ